jgi:hypothetical protein
VVSQYLVGFLVVCSVGGWIGIHLGPLTGPTWYPRVLRSWGRRRSVRVEFVLGQERRLREGPEIEVALGRLYVQQISALFVGTGGFGLAYLLLLHGPHLSESSANSLAVAGVPLLATGAGLLLLQGFTDPYLVGDGQPRVAHAEDYLWPAVRAIAWLTVGASVVLPIAFAVLAAGPSYDASKVFWEGLVAAPLAGLAAVAVVESRLWQVTDVARPDDPTLYVWDCLRARAAQILLAFALGNAAIGFNRGLGGLNGVALQSPDPGWLERASALCWLLQLLASLGFLLVVLQPVAPRLRARLWPTLPPTEPIEFGRPLPIP